MDDTNTQPRKIKLTPDQFSFNDQGEIVIDKEAVEDVLQTQSSAGRTPEAGSIMVGLSITIGSEGTHDA